MVDPGTTQPIHDAHPSGDGADFKLRIGNYQVLREIAVGGMGTVYEAVQDHPRRRVALKLLRSGFGSRTANRRFELESQLLARLRHPGIAQVFEAGTHKRADVEFPYYAMELIPGAQPITIYADNQKLSPAKRIELFAQVCDAVHHAHTKGIIHRDLKPGNILVDSGGQPKVIDFGVARAADSDMAPATLQTQADQLVGTLQYMSPEQCEMSPTELDARSDVYALGVVLYELLCGKLPYDISKTNLSEATRVIRELPPTSPRQLKPDLSDDVETVVLKAMHKDRARRYQSASELAADLRHVLAGEPIDARRDSATYVVRARLWHWIHRHYLTAAIVGIVLGLVAGEVIASVVLKQLKFWISQQIVNHVPIWRTTPPLEGVRLIAIRDRPGLESIASELGVKGVTAEVRQSARRLHGRMLTRLAQSGARVVAFDVEFPAASPYDGDLCAGIEALRAVGIPVVVGVMSWQLDAAEKPVLAPRVEEAARWGGLLAQLEPDRPWSLDLIYRRGNQHPLPSLALATVAASWNPDRRPRLVLDWYSDAAYVQFPGDRASTRGIRVPLTVVEERGIDQPEVGVIASDVLGAFFVQPPDRQAIDAATVDYAQVMRADEARLREWFAGKIVLVGDAREGRDRLLTAPGGISVIGYELHAAGVDFLLNGLVIRPPRLVNVLGMVVYSGYLVNALAAAIVGALALLLRGWRRRVVVLLLCVAATVATLWVFRRFQILFDPLSLVLTMIVCSEGVALAARVGRRVV